MLTWRILKFLAAISAAVLFFYNGAFDPLRRLLLGRYDLRWAVQEERQVRTHTIAFRNSGSEPSEAIQIEIEFPRGAVADFEAGSVGDGPKTSFFQTLAKSSSIMTLPHVDKPKLVRLLDDHYPLRSLSGLEDTLYENVVSELRKPGNRSLERHDAQRRPEIHARDILECGTAGGRKDTCAVEKKAEEWEYVARALNEEASRAWEGATGVSLHFAQGYLCPNGRTTFRLQLKQGESKFLRIRYGVDRVPPLTITRNHIQQSTKVALDDLEASRWWIIPFYHPWGTGVALFVLLALLCSAWAIQTSPRRLPTLQLFNLALQTKSREAWDIARARRDHWVEREFHSFCEAFDKTHLRLSRGQLFQYVQEFLLRDNALYDLQFDNKEELEKTMRMYLRDLVISS